MAVANIIDRRTNEYYIYVDAVFEPSWHDNTCKNATQFIPKKDDFSYFEKENITIEDAITTAIEKYKHTPTTIYLYDTGSIKKRILPFLDQLSRENEKSNNERKI